MTDAQAALAQVREALAHCRFGNDGFVSYSASAWSATCNPHTLRAILAHVEAQAAEIERLTASMKRANETAEHFERHWYLRGDEIERLAAERDKAQSKYERQREATVNTYARVRRLIEALRVTGQHSNRWKLKYKSQVPSLKRTIRDLCAERDELRRQLSEWLRENSPGGWIDELRRQLAEAIRERDELRRQLAEAEQDARRYRWIAGHCRSTSEHWGGRWSIIVDGPAPKAHDSEDAFDAAIDAAMRLTRPAEE